MSRTSRLFSAPANNDLDQQDSSVSERVNLIPNVETVDEEPDGEDRRFGLETYVLTQAVLIGVLSGWAVGVFKLSIEGVRKLFYGLPCLAYHPALLILVPMVGGLLVGLLSMLGSFPPGLRGTVLAVDKQQDSRPGRSFGFLRKTMAAVFTLGTGCSLGPEGPSVEVGMAMSRICINEFPLEDRNASNLESKRNRSRLLLACGAAAGVAAGFNAPIAGVFFALEIVQGAFQSVLGKRENVATATSGNISAILLASVLSALVSKALLGEHLVFELGEYTLRTPLLELPLYLLLGAVSGIIAFTFEKTALFSKNVFDGQVGPKPLRQFAEKMPKPVKPVIGGLICGVAGLAFPQILFFGYETLNSLLANSSLPTGLMLWLLVLKILTTAISAGSGLVGGTFAPSLFLGGMVGASFHNLVILLFTFATSGGGGSLQIAAGGPILELADVPVRGTRHAFISVI
jgi:H+/Cl- antiporter ClcA